MLRTLFAACSTADCAETLDEADLKALLTPCDEPKALLRIAAASKEHPPAVAG